jgi:hypothetical protein
MHGKWARRVWLPGALMDVIPVRADEVQQETLSKYLVELITYDLRRRRMHSLTGWLSHQSPEVQQAIDLAIKAHYRPGFKSHKEQIARLVARGFADALTGIRTEPLMVKVRREVYLRRMHSGIIAERMMQLGFAHLSEYVLSLIRFDLLIGGPHKDHAGPCPWPKADALDKMTYETYHNTPPTEKCMVDYVIEEIMGREMTPEERDAALKKAAEQLVDEAMAAQKTARKNG